MSARERRALKALAETVRPQKSFSEENDVSGPDDDDDDTYLADDVLDGRTTIPLSNAGGELLHLTEKKSRKRDLRHRKTRAVRRDDLFLRQMDELTNAYMKWSYEDHRRQKATEDKDRQREEETEDGDKEMEELTNEMKRLKLVDVFVVRTSDLHVPSSGNVAPAIVEQGFIPCAPDRPSTAIAIRSLELYRVTKMRNAHHSIQAYVKTLCDLHHKPFDAQLSRHFSIAFDIYTEILARVDILIHTALRRNSPNWRLTHVCPACMYTLKDEPELKCSMLYTMDGNDSLKRVFKRSNTLDGDNLSGSSELPTLLKVRNDRYIDRDVVDRWANAQLDQVITAEDLADNPCAGRWKNMKEDITKKMWGVFDETGIFLAICRHGFSLLVVDMVKSGELAKYPLAIVERMLEAFGKNLVVGYDIGCKFKTTMKKSRLGPQATKLNHNCLLDHLTTYFEGIGLEDFEGCERKYSRSNTLAGSVRHASAYHRQHYIDMWLHYTDEFDVYPALTTFLYNNYRQALKIMKDGEPNLKAEMKRMNIKDDSVFAMWLAEEKAYLLKLQKEPNYMLLMYQGLILIAYPTQLRRPFNPPRPGVNVSPHYAPARNTRLVQDLERRLEIDRWTEGDDDWIKTGRLVAMRSYQRALDKLEGLVVARIFELNSMNRPGMGYAMRQHIGKALKSRGSAIRSALQEYNSAAASLNPPRPQLSWDDVSRYAFLADFDLLRDAREDISTRAWAKPAARSAMDMHFKILRAREEIARLNVEIKRVATYLHDEDKYLSACEEKLRQQHPPLAFQVAVHRSIRSRCNASHAKRLRDIAALDGFTGSIEVGQSTLIGPGESASLPDPIIPPSLAAHIPVAAVPEYASDLEDTDEDEEEASMNDAEGVDNTEEAINTILSIYFAKIPVFGGASVAEIYVLAVGDDEQRRAESRRHRVGRRLASASCHLSIPDV
ncbi:hypothetical protein CONPUDRAFT_74154 [Coniophora puteana RWD-64-598 SS2]|uniref:CxC1-like cysteine cluster associated with KDZ transposases domain-containing protein n=1 Tax=Coniophora puteana (strain RWD-64-598) TaxID=741705 RepID=A0A5M3MKX7_CONPW|nr:uncharacterized protein CONPUDRAFT_74154 [Coniophora puteana RWD-64-598 SS2]EIW79818.1 hypothetical protein CONPUDRAFT_74154 [Coniophora puteana RWD-64-598 SS2]